MTRTLLVLRPEPGAGVTVAAARALGLDAVAGPLFLTRPIAWTAPDPTPPALLLTSANAARHGGAGLAALIALPVYAVGEATAAAAREHGFTTIIAGHAGVDAILAQAKADGIDTLLHLVGREHHPHTDPGIRLVHRIVYAADAVDRLPGTARAALPNVVALLHSARAGSTFARLIDEAGWARTEIALAAISPAALAGAGTGWKATVAASRPEDSALLAAAAKLCDQ